MKQESFHALMVDWHFGELTPETVELLDFYLAHHPSAMQEKENILQTIEVTKDVFLNYPELHPIVEKKKTHTFKTTFRSLAPLLSRAALWALLATSLLTAGFMAGRFESSPKQLAETSAKAPLDRIESPWARYRVALDPGGQGIQVVHVETKN